MQIALFQNTLSPKLNSPTIIVFVGKKSNPSALPAGRQA
ncbi:MAG: hypothetical protein ABR980_06250 [Ignavibacteriaceae bacterium]